MMGRRMLPFTIVLDQTAASAGGSGCRLSSFAASSVERPVAPGGGSCGIGPAGGGLQWALEVGAYSSGPSVGCGGVGLPDRSEQSAMCGAGGGQRDRARVRLPACSGDGEECRARPGVFFFVVIDEIARLIPCLTVATAGKPDSARRPGAGRCGADPDATAAVLRTGSRVARMHGAHLWIADPDMSYPRPHRLARDGVWAD